VAIKYRDEAGNTWTGRGKTPRWLVEAEKAGKPRESFKIPGKLSIR
jgi:DNA-binding protein H-NS